jgi:hypothetical protein
MLRGVGVVVVNGEGTQGIYAAPPAVPQRPAVGDASGLCAMSSPVEALAPSLRTGVGRLFELQLAAAPSLAGLVGVTARMAEEARARASAVIFADYRVGLPFPQAIADQWSRSMRALNGNVARSAILVDPRNETFNLQLERVVRCAGLAERRCFADPAELRGWLRDVLTDFELTRVDELLGA